MWRGGAFAMLPNICRGIGYESDVRHLIRVAKEDNADLIATGAYGHSRLGEWMFGGMTRGLLDETPFCLMMSH